jgi:serine/threonine-protein kinase RsbW
MISPYQERTLHSGLTYCSTQEIPELLACVEADLRAAGYGDKDIFVVRLAVEEALINAIKHGHNYDRRKRASFRYEVTGERVVLEVEDEGCGFDPDQVPDPLLDENLEKPSGRGLFLMRAYMTSVRYNDRGNHVTMCKMRSHSGQ